MSFIIRDISVLAASLAVGTSVMASGINAPCLAVTDSRGKVVGTLLDESGEESAIPGARVALDIRGRVFTVTVNGTGVVGGDEGRDFVLSESPDCSGSPFISQGFFDANQLLPRTAVASPSSTLYAQVPGEVYRDVAIQSIRRLGAETCSPQPFTYTAVKAAAIVDLSTQIELPLSINSHGCNQ